MLTMVFLPATFVAVSLELRALGHEGPSQLTLTQTVFSMTFFNWNPEQDEKMMSPWFWIYVVITVVFTLVTMCIWLFFNRRISKSRKNDLESGSIMSGTTICASEEADTGDHETVPKPLRRLTSSISNWGKGHLHRGKREETDKPCS